MWRSIAVLEGKKVEVETTDGCRRLGVFTGLEWSQVQVDGEMIRSPAAIALDNEPGDSIPWHRIRWIKNARV